MTSQPFVDLRAQFAELRDELLAEIHDVFAGGGFIGGDRVRRFETEFAALCQAAHCVGVANGTDALHLALRAVGVGAGDEVITAPNTFAATVEAIRHCGAHPAFVDVHRETLLMDAGQLDAARTGRTRAVVPVHLYGQLADMEAIARWCARQGIALVEDAAQAHGARGGGARPGPSAMPRGSASIRARTLGRLETPARSSPSARRSRSGSGSSGITGWPGPTSMRWKGTTAASTPFRRRCSW